MIFTACPRGVEYTIEIISIYLYCPGKHMGKCQKHKKKATYTGRQEVSHFPAGNHMAAWNRPESMTNMKHK